MRISPVHDCLSRLDTAWGNLNGMPIARSIGTASNTALQLFDLSALRLVISAGETVNPEIIERWRAISKVPLLDGYGLTETLMVVLNYPPMRVKPGSMGRPLPGTDAAVFDDQNKPVKPGEPGRLMIRLPSPQAMLGYWNDPQKTGEAIDADRRARAGERRSGARVVMTGGSSPLARRVGSAAAGLGTSSQEGRVPLCRSRRFFTPSYTGGLQWESDRLQLDATNSALDADPDFRGSTSAVRVVAAIVLE